MCKVSVIVPIYNVNDYIDECILSIVNQTFKDIEILLIIGKSTDGSTEKCFVWAEKDDRISVVEEWKPGLANARNQGVHLAKGEFVIFIDSDDYIDKECIALLHDAICRENADIAECDFYRLRNFNKHMEYNSATRILKKELDVFGKLRFGYVMLWKLLIRKSFIIENDLWQLELPSEDAVAYVLYLLLAKKIVNVNKALYYYRKERENSLCEKRIINNKETHIDTLKLLLQEVISRELFKENEIRLEYFLRRHIPRILSPMLNKTDKSYYFGYRNDLIEIYNQYFSKKLLRKSMTMGGFNLTRIVNKLQTLEDPYMRIQFSSIISLMSLKENLYDIKHPNGYRQYMLEREFHNEFFEIVKEERPEVFYFDLLEERHDILQIGGDVYCTKSDAFDGAEIRGIDSFSIIKRDSKKCIELWKQSCDKFFEILLQYVKLKDIYLIENYLTERYSDGVNIFEYENIDEIRNINHVLEKYYTYIKENYIGIQIIEAHKVENYVTDIKYEFGCYPWHLNEWANVSIAEEIEKASK